METERAYAVLTKLTEYVKSPSLAHIRNPHELQKLAKEIVQALDRAGSVWTNWESAEKISLKPHRPAGSPKRNSIST